MVQTIKSVLLFDYDSIYRSLSARAPGLGDMLGARAGVWLEAIESGDLIASGAESDARRRFQLKRCYADPKLLGKNRGWLTANGVQIVDCTPAAGLERGAGDVHLVLDSLDAAETEPDEMIVLSGEADLTPLLFRLRALNQRIIIYAADATAVSYRTFADGVIREEDLIDLLGRPSEQASAAGQGTIPRPPRIAAPKVKSTKASEPLPAPVIAPPVRPAPQTMRQASPPAAKRPVDREALATLVRRIHQATSVPLFSPRAFADLFRFLADGITAHGYKFAATTEQVTDQMIKAGRNVTKRQVGFIVKGLTLRGHVFSAADSAESLAGLFYEQVLYLVETAKLDLSEAEKGLVQAWIVGFRAPAEPAPAPARIEAPAAPASRVATPAPAEPPPAEPRRRFRVRPEPQPVAAAPPQRTAAEGRREARAEGAPMRTTSRPVPLINEPAAPPAESPLARRLGRNGVAPAAPRTRPPPAAEIDARREAELEDSILSAIADAVDVLADDMPGSGKDEPPARPAPARRAPAAAPAAATPPVALDDDVFDADEIGDEIQRILASYNEER